MAQSTQSVPSTTKTSPIFVTFPVLSNDTTLRILPETATSFGTSSATSLPTMTSHDASSNSSSWLNAGRYSAHSDNGPVGYPQASLWYHVTRDNASMFRKTVPASIARSRVSRSPFVAPSDIQGASGHFPGNESFRTAYQTHETLDRRHFDSDAESFRHMQFWLQEMWQVLASAPEGAYPTVTMRDYTSSWSYWYSYPTFTLADSYPRVTTSYITSSSLLYISTVFEVPDLPEICGPPVSRCTTHCGPCTIEGFEHGEIQLLYWPTKKQMNQSRSNENKSASAIFHGYTL